MSSTRYHSNNTQDSSPTLNSVLEIAKNIEYNIGPVTFSSSQTASSIQLIGLLKEILDLRDNIQQIQEVLTKFKDSKQSFDLVKKSEIEKKIKVLSDFSNHVGSIISNKQSLIMRLKDPFVGEHINIEPEYHKALSELFPAIVKSIASLPNDMKSTLWIKRHTIIDEKINNQIYGTASLIAMYGNYSDSLDRVRQALKEMHMIVKEKGKNEIH
ncbi:HAUS augmin-like complex subunit 2-domain-containing protein [Glomus cerebriforme]|uniref:HAUS augmin-like complex subunit 2-domain-containing protein n=1 Tax=Glomus cerebriforme TaxID=658196 RepID=A0A397T064_9GLOM|nr:HAUS augmin-like complex subunit 2-domain-containing protein [Glomus cerebriforme]